MVRLRLVIAVLGVPLLIMGPSGTAGASASPNRTELALVLSAYDAAHDSWVRAFEQSVAEREALARANDEVDDARASEADAHTRLEQSRGRLSRLGAVAYMSIGADARSSSLGELQALASGSVRTERRRLDVARRRMSDALESLDRASEAVSTSSARVETRATVTASTGRLLEDELADAGVRGVSAEDFWAARRVREKLTASGGGDHECPLPLALLVAAARSFIDHAPTRGIDPTESERVIAGVAASVCASNHDLTSHAGLLRAMTSVTHNPARARSILAFAHRLSRSGDHELELGRVPEDPSVEAVGVRVASESGPSGGSITELVVWSVSRLGTPYSQCLGSDLRPEDPPCPPGTDRFGNGFFDCSGFVAAAYASIGLSLPTSTEAMFDDPDFMSHRVGGTYDASTDQPGDLLLGDGHVALSVGGGTIIHASGGSLTMEPLPSWVRDGVVAVVRPLTTVG